MRNSPIAVLAVLGAALLVSSQDPEEKVLLGKGEHTYEWVSGWGTLPEGMSYGNTHGCIAIDSKDRVYVNTDSEHAVIVFDSDGKFLKSWGKELAGGLHGMTLVEEDGEEFLYLAHIGQHAVMKATLDGEILWKLGYPEESGHYEDAGRYRPTSVAVAPNGDLYVADGYGTSWIHHFDAERKYVRSIGGPGEEEGKFRTPHGIWIAERDGKPALMVADRENHRLQVFDLEGEHLATFPDELRRPCHLHPVDDAILVPDLAGRVTILDANGKLITHLGDNPDPKKRAQNGVPREQWKDGEFLSPHCAHWDSKGDLYVMDWNFLGRISKLARVSR